MNSSSRNREPDWKDIIEKINRSRVDPDLNADFFFQTIDSAGIYNYHMNIELDSFLTFWLELTNKENALSQPITFDDFAVGAVKKIVTCRAIESITDPSNTGFLEFYKII